MKFSVALHPSQRDLARDDADSQCCFGMHAGFTDWMQVKSIIIPRQMRIAVDLEFRTVDREA